MDREKLIEIIKQIILNKSEIDINFIENLINNLNTSEYKIVGADRKEAELVYVLLSNYNFYELIATIEKINDNIKSLSNANKYCKLLSYLIPGYFSDLMTKINRIITIEIDSHLNCFARKYYMDSNFSEESAYRLLLEYSFDLEILSGLNVSDEEVYEQQSIFMPYSKINVREKISYLNYNRSLNIKKNTLNLFNKYYDESNIIKLQKFIHRIIDKYVEESLKNYLKELFDQRLSYFSEEIQKNNSLKSDNPMRILNK